MKHIKKNDFLLNDKILRYENFKKNYLNLKLSITHSSYYDTDDLDLLFELKVLKEIIQVEV